MERDGNRPQVPSAMRMVFGLIMIVVYVGMGILLLINFFDWQGDLLKWLRIVGGIILIAYGIWRAYRQFKGIDSAV